MTVRALIFAAVVISLRCVAAKTGKGLLQQQQQQQQQQQPLPKGFTDDFRVFIGTGVMDTAQQPDPPFVNCSASGVCDGEYFHKVVMGRSEEETVAFERNAKDFFLRRFGIDVDSPTNFGRITFGRFLFDPRDNYRNYVAAGKAVPPEGWFIYDGGWSLMITDPAGYELGGEWAGTSIGAGSGFAFGNYVIMETNELGDVANRVPIYFRSFSPLGLDDGRQETTLRLELSLDGQDFPTGVQGQAIGYLGLYPAPEVSPTALKWVIRNVLTFGPSTVMPGLGPDGISGDVPLVE